MLTAPCRIFRENQSIEENAFNFQEDEDPVDYVEKLCENMQVSMYTYTLENVIIHVIYPQIETT